MDEREEQRIPAEKEIAALRIRIKELEQAKADLEQTQALLHKAEDSDRRFADDLNALIGTAIELSKAETADELCRQAVELGRSRLGFDRMGIWFRTDEPDVIVGSFGVDEDGNILDERDKRTKVEPTEPAGRILLSNESYALVGEAPILNARGETVGKASEVFAALWDGKRVIGHISADNHVLNQPLEQHQCELLRLYGSFIGYTCTRKRHEMEREKLIEELQEALAKIKTLRGLLPICSRCKKIRDDQGYWQRTETYIREHSEADFSHSLCPDCIGELYPELAEKDRSDKNTPS